MDIYANSGPASRGFAITPSDTVSFTLDRVSRGIYVGVAGNVVAVMLDGSVLTFVGVPAGAILPIQCTRINNTSTTATTMVALY
jgi:hypothetical protein